MSLLLRINLWLVGTFLVFLAAAVLASRLAMLDVGPVAAVLVERASRRARDGRELIEMLANEVDDRSARDRFIAEVRGRMARPASL